MPLSRLCAVAASIAIAATTVSAQAPGTAAPRFEVVSIKPSTPFFQALADGSLIGMRVSPGRVSLGHMDLNRLIQAAYGIKKYQVVGPDWLMNPPDPTTGALFDIEATLPAGATADQVPAMLQALLADRFKLAVRRGSRADDTYALIVSKGGVTFKEKASVSGDGVPVLESAFTASQGPKGEVTIALGAAKITMLTGGAMQIDASTIQGLIDALKPRLLLPVIDKTGLNGNFDIKLEIPPANASSLLAAVRDGAPPDLAALTDQGAESARTAVEKLGLKLEPQKNPIATIIVEHVEQTPTEN